jgi:hypothetical protein
MAFESEKIMFEVYREADFGRKYRVVYFTELTEHNKEAEINAAMAGEHFYDGFIKNARSNEAKQVIDNFLQRLNTGETVSYDELESALMPFVAA